ncbi:reverse transcriptase domain-containing protein [Tanacetum coccineum]
MGRSSTRKQTPQLDNTWDEMLVGMPVAPVTDDTELGQRMTNFVTTVGQDTDEIYRRVDEAHDANAVLSGESTEGYSASSANRDCNFASSRPRSTGIAYGDTETDEYTADTGDSIEGTKMAPKRATRSTPAATTTTTYVTNAQLKALIDQGVANALAARDTDRSRNGEDSHDSGTGVRRQAPPARECTYPDFLKCKPLYFKGTEGVFELTQWFERMETVFHISNCFVENQIKFSTCTLLGSALTWWNSHVKTVGHDFAYAITWINLKKKMTDKYCPRGKIKKLEAEMMFPEESDKIEKYVGGLPNMIHGSVIASKPKTMQDAIEFATELMDKKICTFDERQSENKIKQDDNQHNIKARGGTLAELMLQGLVRRNLTEDLNLCAQNATITMTDNVLPNATSQKPTCYECGAQGHFKRDCSKLKNNNRGNQGGNGNAPAKVYAVGCEGTNPDSNVVTGTFLLNNHYACVLFDTGADKSFVSTTFSSQFDITPSTLDHYYDVELADGRIIGLNAIIRGCTLNFLNHPFNIDLMPVELGSFDVIIGMDWLAKYQAVIVCAEKIVRIP